MDNGYDHFRYDHFTDGDVRSTYALAEEAKDNARLARLNWQEKMEAQLVKDTLETLEKLRAKSNEDFTLRATAVLKFLVHDFASGILYAQEKLG